MSNEAMNRCLSCGAGKGMHSRLYTRVLNQFPWMVNCTAISSLYNETGIFSIFASAESASADEMVNVLCKELQVRHTLLGTDSCQANKHAVISCLVTSFSWCSRLCVVNKVRAASALNKQCDRMLTLCQADGSINDPLLQSVSHQMALESTLRCVL